MFFFTGNPNEIQLLFKELLIGVTSFSVTQTYGKTKSVILLTLLKVYLTGVLRAWIAACSTGEEAYSLAIAFKEVLESTGKHRNLTLQIFATDLDTDAIEKARRGFSL
jgi:two-component system CheB/CheR fusion protein